MTEFKITPEDVGRIAVDEVGGEYRIVEVANHVCVLDLISERYCTYCTNGAIANNGSHTLTHWKPRTLVAPKRWWNVYICDGSISAFDFDTFEQATAGVDLSNKVARIYAEHWHNHEEGTFHTPEDFEPNHGRTPESIEGEES